MTEQYKPNLGEIPAEDARRDAVHIAVAPVSAFIPLDPGDHVWLNSEGMATKNTGRRSELTIGIADPYFEGVILKEQSFWLFLYPETITNLRHVWEHPAFKAKVPVRKAPS